MSIRLKSYFSGTVEAAMALARKEMGDDAMLIHSRPTQPEVRHLGAYEVVFGIYPSAEQAAEPPVEPRERRLAPRSEPQAETSRSEPAEPPDSLARQVAVLRQEMERMVQSLARQNSVELPRASEPPGVVEAASTPQLGGQPLKPDATQQEAKYRFLVEQELDPTVAREIALGKPLQDVFEVNATLGREGSGRVIAVLIGPPGSGKTTTLAKLAARYGLQARKQVQLLSIDVLRIGASDQLRTLASLLGIGFGLAETPGDLDRLIEEHYKKDLILIDTPGLGKADMEDVWELAQMIGSDPDIDTHLVLPASMRLADLARQAEQFRAFRPRKLIFTRMDEATRYGALLSLAAQTSLPVSFLTQGQRIPDDLDAATKEHLERLLGSLDPSAASPTLGRGAAA
jgi:flagellar biosynthesis protein FlhF